MMIYLYVRIIFLWFLFSGCNHNKVNVNRKIETINNQIFTENVTLKSDLLIVGCGNIMYAYGFIFGLEDRDSSITGIVRCPDGYGENFFVSGTKYIVTLTNTHITDSLKYYSLVNPYEKSNLPVYLVTEIKKLK